MACTASVIFACSNGPRGDEGVNVASLAEPIIADPLTTYSTQCDEAMVTAGGRLRDFNCDTDPGSMPLPITVDGGTATGAPKECDDPTIMDLGCDTRQRLVVLGQDSTSRAVAICRRFYEQAGKPPGYDEVDLIQYNQVTGATCFYSTVFNLPDGGTRAFGSIPAALKNPRNGIGSFTTPTGAVPMWQPPLEVASGGGFVPCISCHDNGPFVRSQVLVNATAKLASDPLGIKDAKFNHSYPYRIVGVNFEGWQAVSITASTSPPASNCTNCHRMGVSNQAFHNFTYPAVPLTNASGTAIDFGPMSVACFPGETGCAADPTDDTSAPQLPNAAHWMIPGSTGFVEEHRTAAHDIRSCAIQWLSPLVSGPPYANPTCGALPLTDFNPGIHLPGLSLWLDPSGVTKTATGTVSKWADRSPSALAAVPRGLIHYAPPVLASGTYGPFVKFTGEHPASRAFPDSYSYCDTLRIPNSPALDVGTGDYMLTVLAATAATAPYVTSGPASMTLVTKGDQAAADVGFGLFANWTTAGDFGFTESDSLNAPYWTYSLMTGHQVNFIDTAFGQTTYAAGSKPHIFSVRRITKPTGVVLEGWADGFPTISPLTDSPALKLDTAAGAPLQLGCYGAKDALIGDIYEVLLVKGSVGDWDMHAVAKYLSDKYKLGDNL